MSTTEQTGRTVRPPAPTTGDRRVRRTRNLLHDAFLELILEKGYEKTTIQDILDRADVGRSTFYGHFRDKEALLLASFDGIRDQLEHDLAEVDTTGDIDVSLAAALLYQHAYRNQHIYRALCGRQGGTLVQRHLRELIGGLLREHLRSQRTAVPVEIAAEFYASAALGLLGWSIDHDFPHNAAWLTRCYRALAGGADPSST